MVVLSNVLFAQAEIVGEAIGLEEFQTSLNLDEGDGDRLAFDEWRRGVYINVEGDTSQEYLFNYYTHSDRLFIIEVGGNEVFTLNENLIKSLVLQNDGSEGFEVFGLIGWQAFKDFPEYPRFCIYLVETQGFELIKYYDKELIDLGRRAPTYAQSKGNRYESITRYFWREGQNEGFQELLLTKQSVQGILNSDELKQLKDYQKKNRIRWSQENEVVTMLEYIKKGAN